MAKSKPQPVPARNAPAASSTSPFLTHGIAVLALLVLTCLYFLPQLQGKKIMQGDILSWEGMAHESLEFKEKTGDITLWTNSMFGGMPTYQINNFQPNNLLQYIQQIGQVFFSEPIGLFLICALWTYLLLLIIGISPLLSWMGAFAFAFTSYNVILYEAGHVLKLQSIGTFAPIIAGVYLVMQRRWLSGGALFGLGMGLALYANHIQMTYYLGIFLILYFLVEAVRMARSGAWMDLLKACGVLLLALSLAVASGASKLWTTYEYTKDTMRGGSVLEPQGGQSAGSDGGLDWEYAMQWSQGPLELFTILIPGVAGGSGSEPLSGSSAIRSDLASRGVQLPPDFKAPLYWGDLPFTSGPVYFGALICLAFLLGMILVRGPIRWWILAGVAVTMLYSMGRHFEGFNRLLYDYLPLMNKFRSPNSITAVTPIFMIWLGLLALQGIFSGRYGAAEVRKALYYSAGSLAGICLFFAVMGPSFFGFTSNVDAQLTQQGFNIQSVISDRQSLMRGDALRSLLIVLVGAGVIWYFLQGKLKAVYAMGVLTLVTVADLWTVDRRYLDTSSFVSASEYAAYYKPRPADEQILQDKDPNYRVLDLSINTFQSSFASYFHKTVGGYHAAKLQRYQDLIERHLSANNIAVLNMLNTRYVIVPGEQERSPAQVQRNPGALGNAWLVREVSFVPTANEEIDGLKAPFDPASTAVVHESFRGAIQQSSYTGEGTIVLASYAPNHLVYDSDSPAGQLAVFSEIWYGPGKGWQAYLDGQPVDHIRANYVLRAMEIPAGKHRIEFRFEPSAHATGEKVSLLGSVVLLLAGLLSVVLMYRSATRSKSQRS